MILERILILYNRFAFFEIFKIAHRTHFFKLTYRLIINLKRGLGLNLYKINEIRNSAPTTIIFTAILLFLIKL